MKFISTYMILVLLFFISCNKDENLDYSKVKIIGHGGMGFSSMTNPYPANSFISIQKAVDGFSIFGVDVDLQLDADNVIWLFHDDLLETTTNCEDCLRENNTTYIQDCQYKNLIGSQSSKKENLLKLESLLEYYHQRQDKPIIFLDIKINDCLEEDELIAALIDQLEKYNAFSWTQINCASREILTKLKNLADEVVLYYQTLDIEDGIEFCVENSFQGITSHNNDISKVLVEDCQEADLAVTIYGVGSKKDITDALDKKPDQLITDNIELTLGLVNQ